MTILSLDHVQLAIPEDGEDLARDFYGKLLGLTEVIKPSSIADRRGVWFEDGALKVHLGIDPDFTPAKKAHPGFVVADLEGLVGKLEAQGYSVKAGSDLPGIRRVFSSDPFGNRVEFLQNVNTAET